MHCAGGSVLTNYPQLPEQQRWQHWKLMQWQGGGVTHPPAREPTGRSHRLSVPEMFTKYIYAELLTFDSV